MELFQQAGEEDSPCLPEKSLLFTTTEGLCERRAIMSSAGFQIITLFIYQLKRILECTPGYFDN